MSEETIKIIMLIGLVAAIVMAFMTPVFFMYALGACLVFSVFMNTLKLLVNHELIKLCGVILALTWMYVMLQDVSIVYEHKVWFFVLLVISHSLRLAQNDSQ